MSCRSMLGVLLGCILWAGAASAEVKDHRMIVPPDGRCYHGAALQMYATFDHEFNDFQTATGKKIAVLHWFTSALNPEGQPVHYDAAQRKFLTRCRELGVIPCINYAFASDKGISVAFDRYTRGEMDRQLREMANLFLEYGEPVMLSINHEMNGNWYSWSAGRKHKNEETAVAGEEGAAAQPLAPEAVFKGYIESWRYVHDFLRKAGCKNVAFCFVVSGGAFANPKTTPYHYSRYYPGDDYVDWLGFDTYNNSSPEALERLTVELESLAKGKPLMVKEWGTSPARTKMYLGGAAAYPGDGPWVEAFFKLVARHPSIKMVSYFHRGKDHKITRPGGEETLKVYREQIKAERYLDKPVTRQ